jgi:hypothetical protein
VRRLLIVIAILVGVEIVGDYAARAWAEGQITSRAEAELQSSVRVDSHIRAFPFLLPLFASGRVSEVDGRFEKVPAGALTLDVIEVTLHGVRLDRDKIVKGEVRLLAIRDGTVSAEIFASTLSKLLHVPIKIKGGEVHATIAGQTVTGAVRIANNRLSLGLPGVGAVSIPKTRLLPCATSVTLLANRVRVSCTINKVPPGLIGAANAGINSG